MKTPEELAKEYAESVGNTDGTAEFDFINGFNAASQELQRLSKEKEELKNQNEKLKRNLGHIMTWIGKDHPKDLLRLTDEIHQMNFIDSTENKNRDTMIIGFSKP